MGECDACCHFLFILLGGVVASSAAKPHVFEVTFAAVETAAYNDGVNETAFETALPWDVLDYAEPYEKRDCERERDGPGVERKLRLERPFESGMSFFALSIVLSLVNLLSSFGSRFSLR